MMKRGMSAVVTTLLIILLTIVAIGVVWVVVKNVIDKGSDRISLDQLTIDLEIIKATVDGDVLNVTVQRKTGAGNLIAIDFIMSDDFNAAVTRRDTTLQELGIKTFSFDLTQLDVGNITSISVAPVFESDSGKELIGEAVDTQTYAAGSVGSGSPGSGGSPGGSECTPVCDGFECGTDGCGGSCGTCDEGFSCGEDKMCYVNECVEDSDATTCTAYECGTVYGNCGQLVDCDTVYGTCAEQHGGDSSWSCNLATNLCEQATSDNSGLIDNSWPPSTGIYFDSDDLTKEDSLYAGYWAGFSGVDDTKCYLITKYTYDESVYSNAIVQVDLYGEPLGISTGDSYEIWESQGDCCDSLPNCS